MLKIVFALSRFRYLCIELAMSQCSIDLSISAGSTPMAGDSPIAFVADGSPRIAIVVHSPAAMRAGRVAFSAGDNPEPEGVEGVPDVVMMTLPNPRVQQALILHREQTVPVTSWYSSVDICRPSVLYNKDRATGRFYMKIVLHGLAGKLGALDLGLGPCKLGAHMSLAYGVEASDEAITFLVDSLELQFLRAAVAGKSPELWLDKSELYGIFSMHSDCPFAKLVVAMRVSILEFLRINEPVLHGDALHGNLFLPWPHISSNDCATMAWRGPNTTARGLTLATCRRMSSNEPRMLFKLSL